MAEARWQVAKAEVLLLWLSRKMEMTKGMMADNYKRYLRELTEAVKACLDALDAEMKQPSTVDRGRRIAQICNKLNIANDIARRFGLGIDFKDKDWK